MCMGKELHTFQQSKYTQSSAVDPGVNDWKLRGWELKATAEVLTV